MSELRIYDERDPGRELLRTTDAGAIREALAPIGVEFERWQTRSDLDAQATQDEIIEAYRPQIDSLMQRHGFRGVDVVSMTPDHPQREALRAKFLAEHVHDDFEVRFFVDGRGLFYLHAAGRVHALLCTRGDLISVPAGVRHWFDMGPAPRFCAIRLFTDEAGWVAQFTGDPIAERFPRLGEDGDLSEAA